MSCRVASSAAPGPPRQAITRSTAAHLATAVAAGAWVALPRFEWHGHAMARIRVSTTVDDRLLSEARQLVGAKSDAALLDQALDALLAQHRRAEMDQAYAAYDEHPLTEPDEWGDLASFRAAAAAS